VTAECPARIDVAGGWSDTPPITYEHGGAVLSVAVTVDGKVRTCEVIVLWMFVHFASWSVLC